MNRLARVERRAEEPMVPLDLLSDRMVAAIAGTGLLVGVAMFGAIAYVPLLVQENCGSCDWHCVLLRSTPCAVVC